MMENVDMKNINFDCLKGAKNEVEIANLFNGDDICIKCNNIIYCDGILTCKYSKA